MTPPAATPDPQVLASNPKAVVFVTANAGSGKTSTLVKRVARLLLQGSAPDAILCVTYTKAAAAEMQRRLYDELGDWAVMDDARLAKTLADLEESPEDLSTARRLFARALETPGGLKIQTIHAFCEKLLRRFPLEAGVSPGFRVLEAQAAAEVSAQARDDVALAAEARPQGPLAKAYARFAVSLSFGDFNDMFATFEAQRRGIAAYAKACEAKGGVEADVWKACGFPEPHACADIEAEALAGIDWVGWRRAAEGLSRGSVTDQAIAAAMFAAAPGADFAAVWAPFSTKAGEPRARMATKSVDVAVADWLVEEQIRLGDARAFAAAARMAEETIDALILAMAYGELYEGAKTAASGLDFGDLIERTLQLLTVRADAAWVLYKLDGGVDHVLLDEAQDTAPEQWEILRALTEEFFAGAGSPRKADVLRTVFAVGDEKQSIYSFQGAAPERLALETRWFKALAEGAGRAFREQPLLESWRSTGEVLGFVDAVFADPEAAEGLRPGGGGAVVTHLARRDDRGSVELWPFEEDEPSEAVDPWLPVDAEAPQSANRKLAARIARRIRAMVADGEAVLDKQTRKPRPVGYGDVLVLVRRRGALFHEIIRALKREGVAVGGADRLRLSDHVVFQDLMALGRFARFPDDDLTLAALLRSPFCDVDEQGLFDLAQPRQGRLWAELGRRAGERPAWSAAHRFLTWVLAEARTRSPFDVYGRALARLDEAGRSMRQRMLTRLGHEAADALDAFLAEALAAEDRQVRDLETFLAQMAATEIEVKREQEDTAGRDGGEVRVMTAHGSKGLEAPIVFLPDTTTKSAVRGSPLMATDEGGFIWAPRKADDCEASAMARAAREKAARDESLRLLYVAMTRARDRLVVCGVATEPRYFNGSWADYVARAFERPEIAERTQEVVVDGMTVLRFGADPDTAPAAPAVSRPAAGLPAWTQALAATPSPALRYAAPSTLAEDERGPSPSPLSERGGLGRFRRGLLIHRLLQLLPDIPPAGRAAAAASLLAREQDLTASQADEMAAAALGVLEDARFAAVFGPGSRAEAAIAGRAASLPPGLAISGRVDRLVVMPDKVLVVDYKTNRPAPDRIEDADPAYLTQMAVYAAVLAEVFPGRTIEAALVWTDGPRLMPVPEKIIAERLAALAGAS
jgi:ATP-dependent helicase/nuclease subunit A